MELLQDFYETTLDALKDAKNDRLWFKTNTKLGKLYYDRGDFNRLAKILKQLHQSCQVIACFVTTIIYACFVWGGCGKDGHTVFSAIILTASQINSKNFLVLKRRKKLMLVSFQQTDDGEDDLKKGTQLLEIYALEIQMYTAQKNNKKLKTLYEQSLHIKSAIPHPLIMGVIRGTCMLLNYWGIRYSLINAILFLIMFFSIPQSVVAKCIYVKENLKMLIQISLRHSKIMMNQGVPEEQHVWNT